MYTTPWNQLFRSQNGCIFMLPESPHRREGNQRSSIVHNCYQLITPIGTLSTSGLRTRVFQISVCQNLTVLCQKLSRSHHNFFVMEQLPPRDMLTLASWFAQAGKYCTGEFVTKFLPVSNCVEHCPYAFLLWFHHIFPSAFKVHSNSRSSRLSTAQQTAGCSICHGQNRQLLLCIFPASVVFLLHRRVHRVASVGWHRDMADSSRPAETWSNVSSLPYQLPEKHSDVPTPMWWVKYPVISQHKIHPPVIARFSFAYISKNQI